MNSLIIVTIAFVSFFWAYRFYAKKLETLWQIDPKRPTPAYTKSDHVDYIPARNWLVLFGHHFSSIAGAGPIIGPVIAVMLWGWLPALLWVIIGSVFIGGVHDFGSLIISVREGGNSIADIAGAVISKRAKVIFSLFVWFTLILVISVFAYLCADTFVKEPKICLPSLGLIPVALLVGYFLYALRVNNVIATIFGLVSLLGLILAGMSIPINLSIVLWLIILLAYCYIASIVPVNILLQPRDYLSSFLLFFGIGVGYLGLVISRPTITMPYYIKWTAGDNYLWPMLFVTVACGAVSGFHSLIASGTTSRQIANEGHAKRISYGGMLTEGVLAVLVIIAIAIIFKPGDNFTSELKNAGPIGIFSRGFGLITKDVLGDYGPFIAVTILNAFILTTLDTATRISRYLTEELFGIKNRYLSTLIIVSLSLALALSGQWNRIWPAFGASNQLVAALALFVLGSWLIAKNKPAKIVLGPAFFMLVTAVGALVFQAMQYAKQKDILLFVISIILLSLAGFMSFDTITKILERKKHG
ncbi:MAG: carbon starvation protein A [Candidatus Omnitrophica bacterium CG08_land_8_20_14_0_20_41_16]|uniref:Carbon starvation protein A n=1 Tax=Candidatus Sherwoodlollariibacterium unditelluris TaxID=1974757 RepID=A0A2G9YK12_9BACT|nr:MAG: carbon starvation protein A [Candidatus Omnitrophica bacterium CG23_combo_of_CG06-09_8_20_14_all_41_10]PIS34182.1 MAG: carbon starvation protein A [Candidatus Omnitrophica bacterium CG08_land_8_20_14_0_20_41_16]